MKYTLSFHQQGGKACQGHNRRAEKSISKSGNVDLEKSRKNITLIDIPIRQAYKQMFSKAVEDFNARQKNQDRIIKDYYDKINQDSKKHTAYEIIIQLGSIKEGSPDKAVSALMNYAAGFEDRNPNLKVIGAYIHLDEQTPHLHLDYIPVAECNRGMRVQNSLTGALKAQGFVTKSSKETAQIQWESSERAYIRQLCQGMKIPLHDEGIGKKRHLSVSEYKEQQDNIRALESQVQSLDAELQELRQVKKNLQVQCDNIRGQCDILRQQIKPLEIKKGRLVAEYDSIRQELQEQKSQAAEIRGILSSAAECCQSVQEYFSYDSWLQDQARQFGLPVPDNTRNLIRWTNSEDGQTYQQLEEFVQDTQAQIENLEDMSL